MVGVAAWRAGPSSGHRRAADQRVWWYGGRFVNTAPRATSSASSIASRRSSASCAIAPARTPALSRSRLRFSLRSEPARTLLRAHDDVRDSAVARLQSAPAARIRSVFKSLAALRRPVDRRSGGVAQTARDRRHAPARCLERAHDRVVLELQAPNLTQVAAAHFEPQDEGIDTRGLPTELRVYDNANALGEAWLAAAFAYPETPALGQAERTAQTRLILQTLVSPKFDLRRQALVSVAAGDPAPPPGLGLGRRSGGVGLARRQHAALPRARRCRPRPWLRLAPTTKAGGRASTASQRGFIASITRCWAFPAGG